MGWSFVGIRHKGFGVKDGILELWLRLLALHLDEASDRGGRSKGIRDQWMLAARGYFSGHVPDDLEEAVSTEDGEKVVRTAVRSLLDALDKAPEQLDTGVLNLLGFEGSFYCGDFDTRRLQDVGHAFLDLLDGRITTDASSSSIMAGCGLSPNYANRNR